jgi:hypothetical protein
MLLLLAAAVAVAPPQMIMSPEPTVSLSAIRMIACDEGSGSGFIIGRDTLATALHVASLTNCQDRETGARLVTYERDEKNDFALMTGDLPKVPYIKYNCQSYQTDKMYFSYGISPWAYSSPVFGQYKLTAASDYTDDGFLVGEDNRPMPGMRHLEGYIVPGNSGGPIMDMDGYAVGINNVSERGMFGYAVINQGYSYELKNTILCKG